MPIKYKKVIKSNLFENTIIGVKQDFKAGKPALTEAPNTIKDETKQHKIQKLNELYGKWSQYTIIKLMKNTKGAIYTHTQRNVSTVSEPSEMKQNLVDQTCKLLK